MAALFICEACTVRAVKERELSWKADDTALVMLEQMRLIDMAHNWAIGTHKSYQSKNRILRDFEESFGAFASAFFAETPATSSECPNHVGPRTT